MKTLSLTFAIVLIASSLVFGQSFYTLTNSLVTIKGTSNVHDWESTSQEAVLTASILNTVEGLESINKLQFKVPVKSIKSTKGRIMDNKTYDALKADANPNIIYNLSAVKSITKSGNSYLLETVGDLTIAGAKKTITMSVKATPMANGGLKFEGSKALKMTSFNVDPPTALLGTMTTGDDITVEFSVSVAKANL